MACNGLEPPTLLALLKHPLCRLGRAAGGWSRAVATLELAILRGTRPPPGSKGLAESSHAFAANSTSSIAARVRLCIALSLALR